MEKNQNQQNCIEEWREIPDHPDYMASSLGRIKSLERVVFVNHPEHPYEKTISERIMKTQRTWSGHHVVNLASQKNNAKVHQLVAAAFYGPRPDGLVTTHLNGNPEDNRAENLAYRTQSENRRDTVRHDTCKIPQKVIDKVKSAKGTIAEISKRYGISYTYAKQVRNGEYRA